MPISKKLLSLVQKAGQSTHDACGLISESVRGEAQSVVVVIADRPFGKETEHTLAYFKSLSALNQSLNEVEVKLREIYALAFELSNPASEVIALPAPAKPENSLAQDVVAKPTRVKKQRGKKRAKASARKTSGLTPNDSKLLEFMKTSLNAETWTELTGSAIANGSGIPLGSVGISLKKLVSQGAVVTGKRSEYKLGAGPTSSQLG